VESVSIGKSKEEKRSGTEKGESFIFGILGEVLPGGGPTGRDKKKKESARSWGNRDSSQLENPNKWDPLGSTGQRKKNN